jgi:predicted dehydrogenase
MTKRRIALYGTNGHQITNQLVGHPTAELVAVAAFGEAELPNGVGEVARYDSLEALLADDRVELVSLCSPLRSEQAADAIACMKAGKHVYAEKPCAMTEADLDAIIATSSETGMQFHEMAATLVEQPYKAMREVVASGTIGDVVQVFAQKSYPWAEWRPADEDIDGGLAMQVGVYLTRFAEHVAGQQIASIALQETKLGNDVPGSACRRAMSFAMNLENGGVASGIGNYLNALSKDVWGYEIVRIFGTDGIVESTPFGPSARLIRNGEAPEPLDLSEPSGDYLDMFVGAIQGGPAMPLTIEAELSPTRWVIRAKQARYGGTGAQS